MVLKVLSAPPRRNGQQDEDARAGHHETEGEEGGQDRRDVVGGEGVEALHFRARGVEGQKAQEARDGQGFDAVGALFLIRPGQQIHGHMGAGFPVGFHRGELRGLVFRDHLRVMVALKAEQQDEDQRERRGDAHGTLNRSSSFLRSGARRKCRGRRTRRASTRRKSCGNTGSTRRGWSRRRRSWTVRRARS